MKRTAKFTIVTLLAGLALAAEPLTAEPRVSVGIKIGPPVPRREIVVVRPYPRAVWVAGHWYWHPRFARYIWIDGRWIDARPGYIWVDCQWKNTPYGWAFTEGHWRRV